MPFKSFTFFLCFAALTGCMTSDPQLVDADISKTVEAANAVTPSIDTNLYRTRAQALVQAIESGKSDTVILEMADQLTHDGLALIPALVTRQPECATYLAAITAIGPTLKELPLAEIESGYHADGKLPPMPASECYHGKDLVVHPATVAALARVGLHGDASRRKAKGEIIEVLGHLGEL